MKNASKRFLFKHGLSTFHESICLILTKMNMIYLKLTNMAAFDQPFCEEDLNLLSMGGYKTKI